MAQSKLDKIATIQNEIEQLENRKKLLLRQQKDDERKARNHRLCKRGGLFESLLPDTIVLSDERFQKFLTEHVANKFGLQLLDKLKVEQEKEAAEPITNTITDGNASNTPKLAPSPQIGGAASAAKTSERTSEGA